MSFTSNSIDSSLVEVFPRAYSAAWLFTNVVNVSEGPTENRFMTTGLHVIRDIYCNECSANLGWKYVEAFEDIQKYKKGRYILEKALIVKVVQDPFTGVIHDFSVDSTTVADIE
eukprot:CAMPEP_0113847088 /NCGR_PEP_ID=MMETSP0372-20130328/1671_1 /TAXON_ID=340204 /ORGANISM="Lankesteria abbotti" /LENGTH=113 /DNA_ID=CAMNT_0000816309 /DNA_START=102 /DNA_END=444 /DNA_ORIENTATION=+ /assembly_acc=CAM_ASM_000359